MICLGYAYADAGRYEDAIETYKKVLEQNASFHLVPVYLSAVYMLAGHEDEARAAIEELLKKDSKLCIESVKASLKRLSYKSENIYAYVIEGRRKADLPETPPPPLPDKPSIAVLPFVNMSGDPEQERFSDGLTEDIITALSKTPKLFVIARHSSFTYKGKSVSIPTVGRELGVRYVLEGSVRKSGGPLRVTAQLIDAQTNKHIWTEQYDRDLKDIFATQDQITKNIITALHVQLTEGQQANLAARGTDNLQAFLKASKTKWYGYQSTKEGLFKANQLAEESIALDPNYAYAYGTLSMFHGISVALGISKSPQDSLKRAIELCQKAIAIDDSLAFAHSGLGYWLIVVRQYDKAIAEAEQALALAANSADVIYNYAATLTFAGRLEEAIPLFKEAIRLNPIPPNSYLRHFGIALRDSGRYEEALLQAKKTIEQEPNDILTWVVLTSSLSLAGRDEEARAVAKEVLRINLSFSVVRLRKMAFQKDKATAKRVCDALRMAGLPE